MDEITAKRLTDGAAAGLIGTFLIQALLNASQKWAPQSLPPMRQDPGEFMLERVEQRLPDNLRQKIPGELEKAAAKSLGLGYGTTFGALFATSRPEVRNVLLEGSLLGLLTWAAGYLGWLPATGLMPSITKQEPQQIAGPVVSHVLFGIVTVGLYRLLHQRN